MAVISVRQGTLGLGLGAFGTLRRHTTRRQTPLPSPPHSALTTFLYPNLPQSLTVNTLTWASSTTLPLVSSVWIST